VWVLWVLTMALGVDTWDPSGTAFPGRDEPYVKKDAMDAAAQGCLRLQRSRQQNAA
jgi:hypothetical protein